MPCARRISASRACVPESVQTDFRANVPQNVKVMHDIFELIVRFLARNQMSAAHSRSEFSRSTVDSVHPNPLKSLALGGVAPIENFGTDQIREFIRVGRP